MIIPTFFGIEIIPNHIYKANIQHELIITRATIDPNAKDDQNARLFVNIEKDEGPVCHLDCQHTTVPLRIRVSPNEQLILRVAGSCPIHVTGYTSPDSKNNEVLGEMIDESDSDYYEEEQSGNEKEEEIKENESSNKESNEDGKLIENQSNNLEQNKEGEIIENESNKEKEIPAPYLTDDSNSNKN